MIDRLFFRLTDALASMFEAIGLASHAANQWPTNDIDRRLP